VLLLCAGSVIPAQMSSSANFLFVTRASAQSNNPAAEPSALDKVTGYRDLVSKLQGKHKYRGDRQLSFLTNGINHLVSGRNLVGQLQHHHRAEFSFRDSR